MQRPDTNLTGRRVIIAATMAVRTVYADDWGDHVVLRDAADWDHPLGAYALSEIEPATECGKRADDYDRPGDRTVNGHYHYADGACDTEPPYSMGGPA